MKKLFSAVLLGMMGLLLAAPAFADAALPPKGPFYFMGGVKLLLAAVIAVIIVAVAIIVVAVRYRQEQAAAEMQKRTAKADTPEEK